MADQTTPPKTTPPKAAPRRRPARAQAEPERRHSVARQVERAVLIPVGAALVARDNAAQAATPLTSPAAARRQLAKLQKYISADVKRFERRGNRERTRVRRDVKRARTRVERELRIRARQARRTLGRARP